MVIEVPLTKGLVALIDEQDLPLIEPHTWCAKRDRFTSYAITSDPERRGKLISMHRMILVPPPGFEVDHTNRNGLDNRRCNIRICTRSQNIANCRPRKSRSSYRGVRYSSDGRSNRPWKAQVQGKQIGRYATPEEAALAYNAAAIEVFGEFAQLNEVSQPN